MGFGSLEEKGFVSCGRHVKQDELKRACTSLEQYHENLQPVYVLSRMRSNPDVPLQGRLLTAFRSACGSLQRLVAQLREDLAFKISALQSEQKASTVGNMLRTKDIIAKCRKSADFKLTYGDLDWKSGIIIGVSDAALGNVTETGSLGKDAQERVHSQAEYLLIFTEKQILESKAGPMVLWDWRSHRLNCIGNSSFMVETYGLDECVDAGQLLCGYLTEIRG